MLIIKKVKENKKIVVDVNPGDTFKTWNNRLLLVTRETFGTYTGKEAYVLIELNDSSILKIANSDKEEINKKIIIDTLNNLGVKPVDIQCEVVFSLEGRETQICL